MLVKGKQCGAKIRRFFCYFFSFEFGATIHAGRRERWGSDEDDDDVSADVASLHMLLSIPYQRHPVPSSPHISTHLLFQGSCWQWQARHLSELAESDIGCVLTEATTAHVEVVLADQTTSVVADTAASWVPAELSWVCSPGSLNAHIGWWNKGMNGMSETMIKHTNSMTDQSKEGRTGALSLSSKSCTSNGKAPIEKETR